MADKTPYLVERLKYYRTKAAEFRQEAKELALCSTKEGDRYKVFGVMAKADIYDVRAETMEHVLDVLGVEYDHA